MQDHSSVLKSVVHVSDCIKNESKNIVDITLHECRKKVKEHNFRPIPTIYNECVKIPLEDKGIDLVADIPSFESVKSGFYKTRYANAGIAKLRSNSSIDVEIPNFHSEFVLCDYNHDNRRIIIFCTDENRKRLSEVKHVFCDGTFQSCPAPFLQLYSIHADLGSSETHNLIIPVLFLLMSDRKQESYDISFQLIKSQIAEFNPLKFTVDLERAAIKAIANNFPSSEIKSCYYHFKKNLWKKGQALGLTKFKITKRTVLLCGALALLPTNLLNEGWTYVKNTRPLTEPNISKFIKYMQFWIKNTKFHNVWSAYGERHRTNNCVENWHKNLNKIGKDPTIVTLLNSLKKDCKLKRKPLMKPRKKQCINYDRFIQEMQLSLIQGDITIGHFLEAVK